LDAILTVLDPDANPYSQYGSGSRGAISIQILIDPDPDPKHWPRFEKKLEKPSFVVHRVQRVPCANKKKENYAKE